MTDFLLTFAAAFLAVAAVELAIAGWWVKVKRSVYTHGEATRDDPLGQRPPQRRHDVLQITITRRSPAGREERAKWWWRKVWK